MQWLASSFWTASAVSDNYEALVQHFKEAKNNPMGDKKAKCIYVDLVRNIRSIIFILDLRVMSDTLQELLELSLDLQECNMDQ
jgi:hypothetical protein